MTDNKKELKNLVKVKWIHYPELHQTEDIEGYISEKAFKGGKNRTDRIKADGSEPYAGYTVYIDEFDQMSVSATKNRYVECFEEDALNTGWGYYSPTGGISSCSKPYYYTKNENGEVVYLTEL